MRWQGRRESGNVEDRRGRAAGPGMLIGGGAGSIILVIIVVLLGGDPRMLLTSGGGLGGGLEQMGGGAGAGATSDPAEDQLARFVAVVLADTEDVWHDQFRRMGRSYQEPQLVLFRGQAQSACGFASAAVGPFYCPGDSKVYIDLGFYEEMQRRFQAPGDFAQAYVIAHEVGHHVQNLLGISDKVHALRGRVSETEYNQASVRLELQADFFAGLWAHHAQRTKEILDPGDIEEALRAASAIGDDRLQKQSQGYVVPESFTHGTSEQRMRWFRRGFESGDFRLSDTFAAQNP